MRGRPILGAIAGLFSGLFLGLFLLVLGALALDSVLLLAVPLVLVVVGVVLGAVAPFGSRGGAP